MGGMGGGGGRAAFFLLHSLNAVLTSFAELERSYSFIINDIERVCEHILFLFLATSILKHRADYRPLIYEIGENICNSVL